MMAKKLQELERMIKIKERFSVDAVGDFMKNNLIISQQFLHSQIHQCQKFVKGSQQKCHTLFWKKIQDGWFRVNGNNGTKTSMQSKAIRKINGHADKVKAVTVDKSWMIGSKCY